MFSIYLFHLSTIYFQAMVLIPKLNACFCLVSLRTGGIIIITMIIIILIMLTLIILINIISAAYTCGNIYYRLYSNDRNNKKLFGNYSTPSISVGGKSAAWHLEVIISALPRIRVRDSLPKIWPVTSPSCNPLHLAKHAASCFTWPTAPE